MPKGKVKEYNPEQGCGTIVDLETNREHTVYANSIVLREGEALTENQEVDFEIEHRRNDGWAVNVRII